MFSSLSAHAPKQKSTFSTAVYVAVQILTVILFFLSVAAMCYIWVDPAHLSSTVYSSINCLCVAVKNMVRDPSTSFSSLSSSLSSSFSSVDPLISLLLGLQILLGCTGIVSMIFVRFYYVRRVFFTKLFLKAFFIIFLSLLLFTGTQHFQYSLYGASLFSFPLSPLLCLFVPLLFCIFFLVSFTVNRSFAHLSGDSKKSKKEKVGAIREADEIDGVSSAYSAPPSLFSYFVSSSFLSLSVYFIWIVLLSTPFSFLLYSNMSSLSEHISLIYAFVFRSIERKYISLNGPSSAFPSTGLSVRSSSGILSIISSFFFSDLILRCLGVVGVLWSAVSSVCAFSLFLGSLFAEVQRQPSLFSALCVSARKTLLHMFCTVTRTAIPVAWFSLCVILKCILDLIVKFFFLGVYHVLIKRDLVTLQKLSFKSVQKTIEKIFGTVWSLLLFFIFSSSNILPFFTLGMYSEEVLDGLDKDTHFSKSSALPLYFIYSLCVLLLIIFVVALISYLIYAFSSLEMKKKSEEYLTKTYTKVGEIIESVNVKKYLPGIVFAVQLLFFVVPSTIHIVMHEEEVSLQSASSSRSSIPPHSFDELKNNMLSEHSGLDDPKIIAKSIFKDSSKSVIQRESTKGSTKYTKRSIRVIEKAEKNIPKRKIFS